jgi:Putative transmembrane protein (Alph_Pro_TM)
MPGAQTCKCSTGKRPATSGRVVECSGTEPDPAYQELIRNSYLALKSAEGSYQTHPHAVRMADSAAGGRGYSLELDWPRKAPPGAYEVEVLACRNQAVVARASALLQVVEVGFPAQLAALAAVHPWGYGGMAVLVAVVAGFTIDTLTVRLRRRSWGKPRPKERGAAALPHSDSESGAAPVADDSLVEEPVQRS